MKKIIITLLFTSLFSYCSFAGGGGGKTASTSAPSSSSASSSSSAASASPAVIIPGYFYKVKKRHLVEYLRRSGKWIHFVKTIEYDSVYWEKGGPKQAYLAVPLSGKIISIPTTVKPCTSCENVSAKFPSVTTTTTYSLSTSPAATTKAMTTTTTPTTLTTTVADVITSPKITSTSTVNATATVTPTSTIAPTPTNTYDTTNVTVVSIPGLITGNKIPVAINTNMLQQNDVVYTGKKFATGIIDTLIWVTNIDTELVYSDETIRVGISQDSGKLQFLFQGGADNFKSQPKKSKKDNTVYYWDGEQQTTDGAMYSHKHEPGSDTTYTEFHTIRPMSPVDSVQNYYVFIRNSYSLNDPLYCVDADYDFLTWGLVTIPFKYQFRYTSHRDSSFSVPDNLTAGINIAVYYGYEFGQTRFYTNPSNTYNKYTYLAALFAGPTIISLTQSSTNPSSNDVLTGNMRIGKNLSPSTAGISCGGAFQGIIGSFNFGLFLGVDLPLTPDGTYWYYSSIVSFHNQWSIHPWLGLGIGYSLGMFTSYYSHHLRNTVPSPHNLE